MSEIRLIRTHQPWLMGRFQQIHRHPIVDGAMGSDLIVVPPPSIDLHCGILEVQKPVLVETFQSKATVERFDKRIGGGLSRKGEVLDNPVRISQQIEFFGGELARGSVRSRVTH